MGEGIAPEWDAYPDTGCEFSPTCLTCPLVLCKHDLPPKIARSLVKEARVLALLAEGRTVDEVAAALGMNRRSVYRLKMAQQTAKYGGEDVLPVFGYSREGNGA